LAKNTIRLAVTTLRAVLTSAMEDRFLVHNPVQGLGRFVKSEKAQREATSLRNSEVGILLRAAHQNLSLRDYALILTAMRAGLREGELAALEWGDLHFGQSADDSERYIGIGRKNQLDGLTCPQQSAIQPQHGIRSDFPEFQQVLKNEWLGGRDSNPDTQIQSLQSYR
jgi:site-specific recombinase XerC